MNSLRPYLARVIAGLIASLAAWLVTKYGFTIDSGTQQSIVEALVGIMLAVFSFVYGILHKALDKKINPADTASSKLAAIGLAQHARMQNLPPDLPPRQ